MEWVQSNWWQLLLGIITIIGVLFALIQIIQGKKEPVIKNLARNALNALSEFHSQIHTTDGKKTSEALDVLSSSVNAVHENLLLDNDKHKSNVDTAKKLQESFDSFSSALLNYCTARVSGLPEKDPQTFIFIISVFEEKYKSLYSFLSSLGK